MRSPPFAALLLAGLWVGCGPAPRATSTPSSGSRRPILEDTGRVDVECPLRLSTRAETSSPTIALFAELTNQTDAAITIQLRVDCGVGVARFVGIRDGYDFGESCAAGDCGDDSPRVVHLEPGQTDTIGYGTVTPGGGACNEPVAAGTYPVTFGIVPVGDAPPTCGPNPVEVVVL